jgi:carboxypeptidase PM20D1
VVAVRTATFKAPATVDTSSIHLASARPFDAVLAARHLGEAVRFQTVSHQDPAEDQPAEWDRLHAWLQATYPDAHRVMGREVVAGHALVYTWKGADPVLAPIVLMAHQDVVPVTPGSEGRGPIRRSTAWSPTARSGAGARSTTRAAWSPCSRRWTAWPRPVSRQGAR